jgi:hypothetical protein
VPRPVRLAVVASPLAGLAAAVFPAAASAHGLVGRQDLPIPRWLFAWAAAIVLVASFVALATLWPKPRLEAVPPGRRLLTLPRALTVLSGAIGVALLVLTVYAGYRGSETATANFAPTFVSVIVWVGVPLSCFFFGDWFRAFNPWRALGRAVGGIVRRVGGDATPEPLPYPTRLGRWPAAAGIVAFAWFELVYGGFENPSAVATAAALYTAIQLVGMSLYGVEAWCANAEAFGVYFGLIGRLAPLAWRGRALHTQPLLSGATSVVAVPGTVALLVALIGTTSFDGFSQGPTWNGVAPGLQGHFVDLGFSQSSALRVAFTIGFVVVIALIGLLYRLGAAGMRSVGGEAGTGALSRRFVHSLLPIALAYVVAHYFSYLFIQGQAVGYLASDPLGHGSDLLGTATATIDYNLFSANVVWYVQVAALLGGHVAGLVIAHDRALLTWPKPADATRSQYWMLAVMVSFTSLGLWLLSSQAQQ